MWGKIVPHTLEPVSSWFLSLSRYHSRNQLLAGYILFDLFHKTILFKNKKNARFGIALG